MDPATGSIFFYTILRWIKPFHHVQMIKFQVNMPSKISIGILGIVLAMLAFSSFQPSSSPYLTIKKQTTISLIGNNLGSRMINFDYFETELHVR